MELLIETLNPLDDPQQEYEINREIRRNNTTPQSQNIEPPILSLELDLAINPLNQERLGPDRVPPDIFINLDQRNREDLLTLFNILLEKEIFSEAGKVAKNVIRRAEIRDWANFGSYRPISLLPVAGKIFERVLKSHQSPKRTSVWVPSKNKYDTGNRST